MKTLILSLSLLLLTTTSFAETVHLKDGRTIDGKIVQKTAQSVQVDLNGVTMTYYNDEIQDIDGAPVALAAPSVKPAAVVNSVPVVPTSTPTPAAPAVASGDKKALILKFIDVFGTRKSLQANFDNMITLLNQQRPQEAQKLRDGFKVDEVIERLIPLYDKHFTAEDLQAYIDFYTSPTGQKLLLNIGLIMKESIDVSAQYLKEKFPDMAQ